MINYDFLKIWQKIANSGKVTNENFELQIFDVKRFIFDSL